MSTENPPRTKAAQSEATRAKLLAVARDLFGERGYANVGTEEIVRTAGVTRGALYHQFADKRDLFRAVLEQVEGEVIATAAARMEGAEDVLAAFSAACRGWLEACAEGPAAQILLLDGPAVLGWEEWRELGERYGLGIVKATLAHGIESGSVTPQPIDPLAHVVVGALDEAALYVARAEDRETALREAGVVLDRLVASLAA